MTDWESRLDVEDDFVILLDEQEHTTIDVAESSLTVKRLRDDDIAEETWFRCQGRGSHGEFDLEREEIRVLALLAGVSVHDSPARPVGDERVQCIADVARRLEDIEEDLQEGGFTDLRERLTDARADLVDAALREALDNGGEGDE